MAFENMLSKMESGVKHLTDRYTDFEVPVQDPHLVYQYEPAVHLPSHEANSKHNYGGGSKNNAAMSALTLLAFLFFLHILQQCIKEHMASMSTPQITIMTAGRESEDVLRKDEKNDKTGSTADQEAVNANIDDDAIKSDDQNKYSIKINTAKPPKPSAHNYAFPKDYSDRRFAQTSFINAMDDDFDT